MTSKTTNKFSPEAREHVAQRRDPAKLSTRARHDLTLKPGIARVFAENFAVYGVRKVWRQLRREGFAIARRAVERLMGEMGEAGQGPRPA